MMQYVYVMKLFMALHCMLSQEGLCVYQTFIEVAHNEDSKLSTVRRPGPEKGA